VNFSAIKTKSAFFMKQNIYLRKLHLHFLCRAITPDGFSLSIWTVKAFTLQETFVAITWEGGK
jgi:hypothetical protein